MTRSRPAQRGTRRPRHCRDRVRRRFVVRDLCAVKPSERDTCSIRGAQRRALAACGGVDPVAQGDVRGRLHQSERKRAALPIVAVYADGRIMTPGPVDAIYPGPLLAPVSVRDVGASGAAAILAAIRQAGLDRPAASGPGIPGDAGTNVFTVVVDGMTTQSRFAGSQPGRPGPVASGDEERIAASRAARPPARSHRYMGCISLGGDPIRPDGVSDLRPPGPFVGRSAGRQSPESPGSCHAPRRLWDPRRSGSWGCRTSARASPSAQMRRPSRRSFSTRRRSPAFTSGGSTFTLAVRALIPDELGG